MKKYTAILLVTTLIFSSMQGFAKSKTKHKAPAGCPVAVTTRHHHSVKHHVVKKTPLTIHDETVATSTRNPTSVVEINKGRLYVNDSFVGNIANPRYDDYKVVVNYMAPPPPVTEIEHSTVKVYTGNKAEKPILGIRSGSYFDEGVRVDGILLCGPADRAGLFPGDVITKIDEHNVNTPDDLVEAMANYNSGDDVSITYKHFGRTETTEAELLDREKAESSCPLPDRYATCRKCYSRKYHRW